MAFHYSPKIVNSGLIFYMDPINTKCYTGTGITFSDLISPSVSTLLGPSYNSTTKSFDTNATLATQSNSISCNTITFADTSEYTLDFWVKFRTGIPTTLNSIFGAGSSSYFALNSTSGGGSWYPTFVNSLSITYYLTTINYNLEQNWGNITFIIKSNRNIDFYFNGIYKGSVSTTNTLFIINRIASGFTGGIFYYPLQGSISATKIYNRSLSSTEVLQNFNSLKSRFGL